MAAAAGVERFELVTTVPSGDRERDARHPLRRIVGELVGPMRDRHERVLRRTTAGCTPRRFDPSRFAATRPLDGANVLLIDDTWTSGASAQSAAAALLAGGARRVAAVVVGRHLNPRLAPEPNPTEPLDGGFDFETCALCAADARRSAA